MRRSLLRALATALLLTACAETTPGARPLDMSAANHEKAARMHDEAATSQAVKRSPGGPGRMTAACPGGSAERDFDTPCWTSSANGAGWSRQQVQLQQRMAADHRAGARALRDAEAQECVGISEEDRDRSQFAHGEDLVSATRLDAPGASGKSAPTRLVGAALVLRAVPGLTKEYLQHAVDCHLARNATMGFTMPEMAFCPLSVKGARAAVQSTGDGFRVDIVADDADAAAEVLKRARALVPGS